jgi:hypothetical protein
MVIFGIAEAGSPTSDVDCPRFKAIPGREAISDNGGEKGKNDGRGHHGHSKKPNLKRVTKRHNPKVGI